MVMSLSWLHEAQIYRARELRGAIFGAPAMVPIGPPEAGRRRWRVCVERFGPEAATVMDGTKGLQQGIASVCGKVPYRLSSGFRPVK